MKHTITIILLYIFISITSCRPESDFNKSLKNIQADVESGNIDAAMHQADLLKKSCKNDTLVFRKADSLYQIAERISLDFTVTEDMVITQIEKRIGSISPEEKTMWEKKGWLEWRVINGKKMYFNRAASNLILIKNFYEQKEVINRENSTDPDKIFRLKHTEEVYKASDINADPVIPVDMKITYTLTVQPDVVPEGELIRCWLPWPRSDQKRQQKINLMSTSEKEYEIAPDTAIHSTLYMESRAKKGIPTVFQIQYSYQSSAQYFNPETLKILPYNKSSDLYTKYTSEQLPQICFTPHIKNLANSLTDPEDTPSTIVKKIYFWFKGNIPWAGALEYSIIPNIPEYVYQNSRGDCGMQTFLFISLLRYKGIPVRWQSGWMVPPGAENLHDWCEVYYEGTGWVPLDISYDLQPSENRALKEFYFSGIDSYRLIVNEGIAGPLHPKKRYLRSEPFDFQRGEVEWKGGNLYFNKWDYDMKIEYLN
jgi:transglutaminase-like putative cysteine protease